MKKERPILFSTPMVQAILEGRKTMTRRIVKSPDITNMPDRFKYVGNSNEYDIPRPAIKYDDRIYYEWQLTNSNAHSWIQHCPYGKPGDILWVREASLPDFPKEFSYYEDTWKEVPSEYRKPEYCIYKASWNHKSDLVWKPSIHMPKWACRIFLEITNVRVERLYDITIEDAIAEGVAPIDRENMGPDDPLNEVEAFETLWHKINGTESWEANPWVWVIEFKRIEKPTQ